MPIEGLSDLVRIPRLGKIRLGIKAKSREKGTEYPKATDYFVVPDEVKEVYGDKPTELDIMFPVEDPELFAQQWLRAYSLSQGLVCISNGIEGRRKVDMATGAIADHETKQWEWKEINCDPQDCPEYQTKRCRRVMNLQFLLPRVAGLGVYQIDTSSFYSIVNINSMTKMLKGVLGRCSMIPLTLALGPIEVSPPGLTKKTVYIMHIKKNIRLAELAKLAQLPLGRVLIPEPETEEPPDDLFPDGILADNAKSKSPRRQKPITESPKDAELFPEDQEPEIPQVDEQLLKGWQIVRESVKTLNITDKQISKWFAHYGVTMSLVDFARALPPARIPEITNDLLSNFQAMLDAYREQKTSK